MSLTRYLPTPSDRMGILWSLLAIEDAIILEYGTAGTTNYAMKTLMMSGVNPFERLFATGLDETDIALGETSRLENKIKELDEKYQPKVIFVMASSVSSLTGFDVQGVCNYLQDEVNAKLIVFNQGGFSGDYSTGIKACYTTLVDELSIEKLPQENFYNIIGLTNIAQNVQANIAQIDELLNKHFSLKPNAILSYKTDLKAIISMSKAKINLVMSYEGLEAAKILEERFGTPYLYACPIGRTATRIWLEKIAEILNLPLEEEKSNIKANPQAKKDKKIAIFTSYDQLVGLKKLAIELGYEIEFLLCNHSINKIKNRDADITYLKSEKEKINLFASLNNTLVLADNMLINHANKSNQKITISALNIGNWAENEAILGLLAEKIL